MSPDESATSAPLKPGDSYVQSFARGLSVIRTFDTHHGQQTLTEVAKRCGLTRAGARRILLTLHTLGYVEQEGRMFKLTPKILDLGFAYLSSQPLWRFAEPIAMQLANDVRESVSIAVLEGDEVVFILRAPLRKIMSEPMGVGTRLPAWATATGRVLLASLPVEERETRVNQVQLARRAGNTVRSLEELRAAIEQARRQHWCLVDQELEDGVLSVAVPITGRDGKVVAAMNISTHASRTPPNLLLEQGLPKLQAAAQNLSQLLVLMKKD